MRVSRASQDDNHAANASPDLGLGQVSRPWLTPNLHLAPGSRGGGGYLGEFVSGSRESWTSVAFGLMC